MRFSDYIDFKDFITKNHMTPEQGLLFLDQEIQIRKQKLEGRKEHETKCRDNS